MAQQNVPIVADQLGLDVQRTFLNFLQTFGSEGADGVEAATPDYVRAVHEMKEQDRTTLYVDYNHLLECVRPCTRSSCAPPRGDLIHSAD